MSALHAFLAETVRWFVRDAQARDQFIADNKAVLAGLAPEEKRALWSSMKRIGG